MVGAFGRSLQERERRLGDGVMSQQRFVKLNIAARRIFDQLFAFEPDRGQDLLDQNRAVNWHHTECVPDFVSQIGTFK